MPIRRSTAAKIYTLHVELQDLRPLIWRRLQIPTAIALTRLHDVLQVAMGWTDSHLHSFKFGEREFSDADDELDELNILPETIVSDRFDGYRLQSESWRGIPGMSRC